VKGIMKTGSLLLALALAAHGAGASAQSMFKCVSPEGKTSFSDRPCATAAVTKKTFGSATAPAIISVKPEELKRDKALPVDADEAPTEAMRARSRQAAEAMQAQTKKMEERKRLMQGSELDRRMAEYMDMKDATAERVRIDEAIRAEESRLRACRRGPEPEKCQ
jgi:hypothetical protein